MKILKPSSEIPFSFRVQTKGKIIAIGYTGLFHHLKKGYKFLKFIFNKETKKHRGEIDFNLYEINILGLHLGYVEYI